MAEVSLVARLERLLDKLPKSGRLGAKSLSLVSRLVGIARNALDIMDKAACLAESNNCDPRESACNTGCSKIYVQLGRESRVWKLGGNSFSIRHINGVLEISTKEFSVNLNPPKITLRIPTAITREEINVDLTETREIAKDHYLVTYTLNKIEFHIVNAINNLRRCIRARQVQC